MKNFEGEWEFGELYKRYAPLVHKRCLYILWSEDEAWDATQEVFMKLMSSMDTIEKKESVWYWLNRTATHHCISVLRKKRGVALDENVTDSHSSETPEKQLIIKDLLDKLFGPWNKNIREIVIYTYIDGYTQKEISQLMGIGESTIRKYLTNFRRKSKEWHDKLQEQENES